MPTRCHLGTVLSYGSEGTVHAGTWQGKSAAVKVLSNQYALRVGTEVKLVMNLSHANIIKYFDLEHEQKTAYLSMEFITGGTLYEFIQRQRMASTYWTHIGQILTDVARGMAYLHARRIVQADLKSHNILLRQDTYEAVICDFGISRLMENDGQINKRSNSTKGTIRWMAPEICAPPPELSSCESDVWSYGCVILETTSGREPWMDEFMEDGALFRALQRRENAPIFARICANQSGPSDIGALLVRCCSWSKADRPRFSDILNARGEDDDFQDALEEMSIGSPIHHEEDTRAVPLATRQQGRLTGQVYTSRGSASGRAIYEGVRGGHYYLTESGKKVYLHK